MSETKLKPCPFCGGEAELYEQKHREFPSTFYVRCKGFCVRQIDYKDKERAIGAWNTRKPMERIVERLGELEEHCLEMHDWNGQTAICNAIEIVKEEGAV